MNGDGLANDYVPRETHPAPGTHDTDETGGGGGGGGAVTIADSADVTLGAKADARATDSTSSWSVVALLKGVWQLISGIVISTASVDTNTGVRADPAITNPASDGSVISLLKGILTKIISNANVGGFTALIKLAPTVSTSAYSAGFVVGGLQTLTNAVRTAGTGIWTSFFIMDLSNQKQPMTVLLFDADPTAAGTPATVADHGAYAAGTATPRLIAQAQVVASDYVSNDTKAFANIPIPNLPVKAASGTSLFAVVVTTGTPTYSNAAHVQFGFGLLQD